MRLDDNIHRLLVLLHNNGGRLILPEGEAERAFAPYDTDRARKLGLVKYAGDAAPGIFDGFSLTNAGRKAIGVPTIHPIRDFFRALLGWRRS